MTADEFTAWLERRGWTPPDAAPRFNVNRATVWRWMRGKSRVPGTAVRLIEMMDKESER